MNSLVEERIRDYERYIKVLQEFDKDVDFVQSLFPDRNPHIWFDHEINVDVFVQSFKNSEDLLSKFTSHGFNLISTNSQQTSKIFSLISPLINNIRLQLKLITQGEDALCKMVITGYQMQEVPVYKLMCNEDAEIYEEEKSK